MNCTKSRNTLIIEIKPQKLHNTPKVLAKRIAAEDFCRMNDMVYEIVDPVMLTDKEIKQLYIENQIKFLDRYDEKFRKKFLDA